jgi:hypothetical protein
MSAEFWVQNLQEGEEFRVLSKDGSVMSKLILKKTGRCEKY